MRMAVTGAAGFVGQNLVGMLADAGHEVVAIDRTRGGPDTADTLWREGDIFDGTAMRHAFEGVEVVFHLAAVIALSKRQAALAMRVNVDGVRAVAEAALETGARRLVHCSSMQAFDPHHPGVLDETCPRSLDPSLPVYHRSKALGENALLAVADRGLDAVICQPTGIFGPVDTGPSRINQLLRAAARGWLPIGVRTEFDLVDVRDVAKGLIAAAEFGRPGESYLLPGHQADFRTVLSLAARLGGHRTSRIALPLSMIDAVMRVIGPIADLAGNDALSRGALQALQAPERVDGAKAHAELGHRPRPTAETVTDLIEYFSATGQLRGAPGPHARRATAGATPSKGNG